MNVIIVIVYANITNLIYFNFIVKVFFNIEELSSNLEYCS